MRSDSDLHEPRTNAEQSETGDDLRVSYESVMDSPEHRAWQNETLHRTADRADTICRCYFIGGESGPVKIGCSVSVRDRLRDIQSCSPIVLRLLAVAPGGVDRETAYHYQFRDYRLHGEWFERAPAIEAEIERLSNLAENACSAPNGSWNIV